MKHVKMLGIAAVAATALMAFVGAGTASATVLCSTNTTPCTGTKYGVGTKVESHLRAGTEAVFTGGFATLKCTEAITSGEVTNAGSSTATVVVKITTLDFTGCNCTMTVLSNGELEVHYTSAGNGTLTGKNSSVTMNCSGVSCIFGTAAAGPTIGPTTGGATASIKAEAKLPYIAGDASNFTCTLGSGTYTWNATYDVTKPAPLFVAAS
jgi:hypothetical protein